jgi:hypothetical protein
MLLLLRRRRLRLLLLPLRLQTSTVSQEVSKHLLCPGHLIVPWEVVYVNHQVRVRGLLGRLTTANTCI